MKKITYSCDICREEKAIEELIGYEIDSIKTMHGDALTGNMIKLNEIKEVVERSTNHICSICSDVIAHFRQIGSIASE